MIGQFNEMEQKRNADLTLLKEFWHKPKNLKEVGHLIFEVKRGDQIIEDSLNKLFSLRPKEDGLDPLKLKLHLRFKDEVAIDVGGVSRDYFTMIMELLFDRRYDWFKYSDDSHYYWFNGASTEDSLSIKLELLGTLMGIALYNGLFIDLPFVPVIYKILLGLEPDIKDLA